ncbi:MAG TPA: YceI family protein, partial [Ktedonobacteraceae bacterium]
TLVEFSVKHLMINVVKGRFNEVQGSIFFDTQQPENSWVKASVNAASISTGIEQRNMHLRSADFFDTEHYPTITFESTRVRRTAVKSGVVIGNLTIRGITHTVSFQTDFNGYAPDPFSDGWRLGLLSVATIDRRLFGMHFNHALDSGISLVGYNTRIELCMEAVKKP